ncbi:MAG: cytochrome P460 family protein [Rhizobiaceae bacterium]
MSKLIFYSTFAFVFTLLAYNSEAQEVLDAHLAIKNPARLTAVEINKVYDELKGRMAGGYKLAKLPILKNYQSWKRYNSEPYLSATHGQRYVNNYANGLVDNYGKLKNGETYPVGTVFAKDSITVTKQKEIYLGAMFVMEKLTKGKSPETADWRYVMVLPDGSMFGDTTGDEAESVEYCHACHIQKSRDDFVFFVPEKYRVE